MGDQPQAVAKLVNGLQKEYQHQTLLGVTGSGKTFTMANVIQKLQKPTLIISHNKTLAAQLASEFQEFFPDNEVHYFVSYYDYYQPEAYIPRTDTYIEKETEINEEIDRLRHAATQSLMTRKDVIIVASVSCIYGLGNPAEYKRISINLETGKTYKQKNLLRSLVNMLYERNNLELKRGTFRAKGEIIELFPTFSLDTFYRLYFFGDILEKIEIVHYLTKKTIRELDALEIFPASHYFAPPRKIQKVLEVIGQELEERLSSFKKQGKLLEAQRLEQRVRYDLEMIATVGYVSGIENYSRYFDGRSPGEPPFTLVDYFIHANQKPHSEKARNKALKKGDFLIFIDESHMTIPQLRGMYAGDRARKNTLVDFGFRLPSALDNRPLTFQEFEQKISHAIHVSATPGPYEKKQSRQTVEQIIRPTGLLDPRIEIRPAKNQVGDLISEIKMRVNKRQRVLVTTLTKRLAEELTEYLQEKNIKVQYLHSEINTLDRLDILQDLRKGTYDVVVGINLLREGLDLPEVSLVAILDADKEGFLRSDTALIQTMGRAARHQDGRTIMYADKITGSMQRAIAETTRRRKIQTKFNATHGITPHSIQKKVKSTFLKGLEKDVPPDLETNADALSRSEKQLLIKQLTGRMKIAAANLEFEKAARLRDKILELKKRNWKGKFTMLENKLH